MQSESELEDGDAAEPIIYPPSKGVKSDVWEYFGFTRLKQQKDETGYTERIVNVNERDAL